MCLGQGMARVCRCPQRPKALDPLKLDLGLVVSCLTWVLGTKPRSSLRAVLVAVWLGMVVHAFNFSIWETETDVFRE